MRKKFKRQRGDPGRVGHTGAPSDRGGRTGGGQSGRRRRLRGDRPSIDSALGRGNRRKCW